MRQTQNSLVNFFLVAMPNLREGLFADSVTYICEHSVDGAMGIVINKPLSIGLGEILSELKVDCSFVKHAQPIMQGGPVQTSQGFVLHNGKKSCWQSSIEISDEVSLATSQDILYAIANDEGPEHSLIALGYAGWSAGQLEDELAENAWLTIPANNAILFQTPYEQRARAATKSLGLNPELISPTIGHA